MPSKHWGKKSIEVKQLDKREKIIPEYEDKVVHKETKTKKKIKALIEKDIEDIQIKSKEVKK